MQLSFFHECTEFQKNKFFSIQKKLPQHMFLMKPHHSLTTEPQMKLQDLFIPQQTDVPVSMFFLHSLTLKSEFHCEKTTKYCYLNVHKPLDLRIWRSCRNSLRPGPRLFEQTYSCFMHYFWSSPCTTYPKLINDK